jgi:hypothetical protein
MINLYKKQTLKESVGFRINRFLYADKLDNIRIKFVLCSNMSVISWWFKVFEEHRTLHNLNQEFCAEIHLNYSFCRSIWTECRVT